MNLNFAFCSWASFSLWASRSACLVFVFDSSMYAAVWDANKATQKMVSTKKMFSLSFSLFLSLSWPLRSSHFMCILATQLCSGISLPALPPSFFYGKYKVSIMVPLFFSVTMPGGCRLQRCHGYPAPSAHVFMAPPSFQAPFPNSSIVDEFKCRFFAQFQKNLYNVSAKLLKQSTKLTVN